MIQINIFLYFLSDISDCFSVAHLVRKKGISNAKKNQKTSCLSAVNAFIGK